MPLLTVKVPSEVTRRTRPFTVIFAIHAPASLAGSFPGAAQLAGGSGGAQAAQIHVLAP